MTLLQQALKESLQFEKSAQKTLDKVTEKAVTLYQTAVHGLPEAYLSALPEEIKQHFTCNTCFDFMRNYGGLAYVNDKLELKSAIWDENEVTDIFKPAIKALREKVENSKIKRIYLAESKDTNTRSKGGFTHLYLEIPDVLINYNQLKTANQVMASQYEDFKMVVKAVHNFTLDNAQYAYNLVIGESVNRADNLKGVASWFLTLQQVLNSTNNKDNAIWVAVSKAYDGYCNFGSSVFGSLLEDIKNGLSIEEVINNVNAKFDSSTYRRTDTSVVLTDNQVAEAEKVIAKLGLADSLVRRYATLNEIKEVVWTPKIETLVEFDKPVKEVGLKTGVFSHLATTTTQQNNSTQEIPSKVMTWEKFKKTVLPTATDLSVLLDNESRFMGLVTEAIEDSKPILKWDNPFSWYYHKGIDGEIKARLEREGGRFNDVDIRCSLIWDGHTDLDLHCITPSKKHIYYSAKNKYGVGELDVDMNGLDGIHDHPVENIFFSKGLAEEGKYLFYVHNYVERGKGTTPFKVELEVNGKTFTYEGVAGNTGYREDVFSFVYKQGQDANLVGVSTTKDTSDWSLPLGNYAKVNLVTTSPNKWGTGNVGNNGEHIFFLVEGLKDTSEGKGYGLFTEMLKSDLFDVRKVLEHYNKTATIQGIEEADTFGVGYSKDSDWDLNIRATVNGIVQHYKIDRWD